MSSTVVLSKGSKIAKLIIICNPSLMLKPSNNPPTPSLSHQELTVNKVDTNPSEITSEQEILLNIKQEPLDCVSSTEYLLDNSEILLSDIKEEKNEENDDTSDDTITTPFELILKQENDLEPRPKWPIDQLELLIQPKPDPDHDTFREQQQQTTSSASSSDSDLLSACVKQLYKCTHCNLNALDGIACLKCDRLVNPKLKRSLDGGTLVKPYRCSHEQCAKTYARQGDLKIHTRTHTGEKPYPCHLCSKRFSANNNLHRHLKVHTGCKPFACDTCGKVFSTNSCLKRHLRIHIKSLSAAMVNSQMQAIVPQ